METDKAEKNKDMEVRCRHCGETENIHVNRDESNPKRPILEILCNECGETSLCGMTTELFISFPDQSKAFTYGVEYGRLLEKMERGDELVKNNGFPVRIENREVIETTCRRFGYNAMFSECEIGGWVNFKAVKGIN